MKIVAKTDIGLVRSTNEDTFVIAKKDDNNLMAFVCDGMGGHLGGAFASNTTVKLLEEAYNKLDLSDLKNVGVWLFETLEYINSVIYEQAISNENLKGMGTTVSGIIKINEDVYYAHVGDSRIYVYTDDDLEQVTTDHTYVNTLLLNGLITFKQAAKHPKKHVLTNALGIKKNVSVDIGQIRLSENSGILLCTDGLHNLIDGKKLIKILNEPIDVDTKANNLLAKTLSLGGTDNITFVILEK